MGSLITLLTDCGTADPFVGVMKGVILAINPEARLVDLCHGVRAYDVREAAFLLWTSVRFFPPGTVHLVVVDPGVGSARSPLVASRAGHLYVAPDNGVLSFVLGDPGTAEVRTITASSLFLHPVSRTFHGRDIFAPVAAHLSRGLSLAECGPLHPHPVVFPRPVPLQKDDTLQGEVLHVDHFGNLITNVSREDLAPFLQDASPLTEVKGAVISGLSDFYTQPPPGILGAIVGSSSFLEIFLSRGDAARRLGVRPGERVIVRKKLSLTPPGV